MRRGTNQLHTHHTRQQMNDLKQELFGSSDSDSDLELDMDLNSHQLGNSMDLDDNSAEFDPIFQSIMNSHEENERQSLHYPHSHSLHDPSATLTNALIPTFPITNYNSRTLTPKHLLHEEVEGLCLHTNVLSDKDQARLMAQITEKNFFKAGQQNQAMCFGQRDLVWLNWLVHGRLFSDSMEDGEGNEKEEAGGRNGVLSEPFCSSSWTTRIPLFDQSIMNLYFPGKATPLFNCFILYRRFSSCLYSSIESIIHCSQCLIGVLFFLDSSIGNGIKPHVDLAR